MSKKARFSTWLLLPVLLLSACQLPGQEGAEPLPIPQVITEHIESSKAQEPQSSDQATIPKLDNIQAISDFQFGDRQIETLSIPVLKISPAVVPVGWRVQTNENGEASAEWDSPGHDVGWVITSALPGDPGNIILYGHNNTDSAIFSNLADLKVGDPIYLITATQMYAYRVSEVRIIRIFAAQESSIQEYQQFLEQTSEPSLTLISCWPYFSNTHRVVVRATPWLISEN